MDLLVIALKALAAQQALQSTRKTTRGSLVAVALVPVGIGLFLIGVGFLGYACYAALLDSASPATAALIMAGGFFVLTLLLGLGVWLRLERGNNRNAKPDFDLDQMLDAFEKVSDKVGDEVKKNPGSSLALAAIAGAFAFVTFCDKR
jgi:hypothetical protein